MDELTPTQLALFIACLGKRAMMIIPDVIAAAREQARQEAIKNAFNDPNPPEPTN